MFIYDTKLKQKVPFEPLVKNKASIYVCGPTVYDDAHLGHARSAIAFDLLRRTLELSNYEVTMVRNFTDIDDKIINKALKENKSIKELSAIYIDSYTNDLNALNVKKPSLEPKASEYLDAMTQMIETLLEKNIAYKVSNGDIYLDTSKDKHYGSLSSHNSSVEFSRIGLREEKRSEQDFVLWKAYKGANDVGFDSPLGKGRPGWHIECSSMIFKTLAQANTPYQIDIHAGGADLLFPHHENEASQTRCAFEVELSKYWMHNGFVNINNEKMSKSLGNSFFIKDALKTYDGEILRNYLLGVHYRSTLNFNEEDLLMSKKRLDKIYRLKQRVFGSFGIINTDFKKEILECMQDDLNISKALSVLENMLSVANEELNQKPKDKAKKGEILANLNFVEELLGIGFKNPLDYFQLGVSENEKREIEKKIAERNLAKQQKDFSKADNIREELIKQKIALLDTPQGTIWEKLF
ncbi:cysteine--tRNA ligase [Helicobacter cetorum]|uniref:Cysteine--tRNA ligase n=1 Tax=Helicobacter cetorum (strain ATCC BAA-540 / CCUG 52418 / MIT 99-5656) TaxID=1163745 RepID=I0ER37_HELCM|nr:cysteine--tRNA ligase [Helicobacter cetorum]AFI05406.1 cysteinyl-tRNA synthetase [Helicobacter cetorum MIT 99-5656]